MLNERANTSDEGLWARVREGDPSAFGQVMERYESRLFNFIYRFLGNRDEAEDVLQDTFLRAYEKRNQWDGKRARLSTWLFTISANRCRDILRKRSREKSESIHRDLFEGVTLEETLADPKIGPGQRTLRTEIESRLREAILRLPETLRGVLILSECEGLDYREIGKVLGCSLGTVKSRAFRARQELRALLSDLQPEREELDGIRPEEVMENDVVLVLPTIDQ